MGLEERRLSPTVRFHNPKGSPDVLDEAFYDQRTQFWGASIQGPKKPPHVLQYDWRWYGAEQLAGLGSAMESKPATGWAGFGISRRTGREFHRPEFSAWI